MDPERVHVYTKGEGMKYQYRVGIWDIGYKQYREYTSVTLLGAFLDYWVRGFVKPKQFIEGEA